MSFCMGAMTAIHLVTRTAKVSADGDVSADSLLLGILEAMNQTTAFASVAAPDDLAKTAARFAVVGEALMACIRGGRSAEDLDEQIRKLGEDDGG